MIEAEISISIGTGKTADTAIGKLDHMPPSLTGAKILDEGEMSSRFELGSRAGGTHTQKGALSNSLVNIHSYNKLII